MQKSIIGALLTLSSLQRWNFLPRVETWSETENVAYITHIGYALGKQLGFNEELLEHLLIRSILKSFNKHTLSDIPIHTRETLKKINKEAWPEIVNKAARNTKNIFPRKISNIIEQYLTYDGNYSISTGDATTKRTIEALLRYVQHKVAIDECDINKRVYEFKYDKIIVDLETMIRSLENHEMYDKEFNQFKEYFWSIRNLRYIRRWNRTNRQVKISVLSHTFMVTFFAFLFAELSAHEIKKNNKGEKNFKYKAMLRALFHDFPESLTGDLITPAKNLIDEQAPGIIDDIEKALLKDIKDKAPNGVRIDIDTFDLCGKFKYKPYSIDSLVKDCDRLALVIECVFEKYTGKIVGEMSKAYEEYLNDLLNSEWTHIREFCSHILVEFSMLKN